MEEQTAQEVTAPAETRASRRATRRLAAPAEPPAKARPLVVAATAVICLLLGLSAYAGPTLLAAAVAFAGLVLGWGWFDLVAVPAPALPRLVVLLFAVAGPVVVALTQGDPVLRNLPAVAAAALLSSLAVQLLRRDGRPGLTAALISGALALALVVCGAAYLPVGRLTDGADIVACAAGALAASSVVDLVVGRAKIHSWVLPLSMLVGGWASAAVAALAGSPRIGQGVLVGFLVAGVAHALRRLLSWLPGIVNGRAQASAASAGVLIAGIITLVFTRLVLGQ